MDAQNATGSVATDTAASASPEDGTVPRTSGRHHYFPGVEDAEWEDWRWQFRNRITSLEQLASFFPIAREKWDVHRQILADFRMGITPYYLSLIDPRNPHDPILRQVAPLEEEHTFRATGDEDPLGEEAFSPVPGITHRYPDRVLFVISNSCAIYCRYCTRKRIMYEDATTDVEIDRMVEYIARTPSVRDVVVSGGDPLTFSTAKLESILAKLRAIPHLEIIRIGSRVPVALPQRIDDELCAMLQKYHPLWINVHFNHPNECTPDAARACDRLLRAGIPLNNQSVLLKGVNDDVATMKALVHGLMRMRVRPYYLYQCDPIRGAEHFRTPIAKGIEVIEGLRGHTSGLAIPQYVIDAPGGGGKIPIGPQYLLWHDQRNGRVILRNYQGRTYEYVEPGGRGNMTRPPAPVAALPGATNGNNGNGNGCNGSAKRNGDANAAVLEPAPRNGALNGNGQPARNGNGHANGNGNGNGRGLGAAAAPPPPVVGKSRWAHKSGNHKKGRQTRKTDRP
ncbi:MAG: KamA family radical SAM protein [Planctomycetes bacterium]|nr:KamA family radical SAM protein [Planctomycetota bacterium]